LRAGDRSPKKERDEKKQKTDEASKDKAAEPKGSETKQTEIKSAAAKEQDDLDEQMRLRRERVAKWRAEKEVRLHSPAQENQNVAIREMFFVIRFLVLVNRFLVCYSPCWSLNARLRMFVHICALASLVMFVYMLRWQAISACRHLYASIRVESCFNMMSLS
jgi:hypothetical protein